MRYVKRIAMMQLCAAILAGAAHADCGPVIAAFQKADATGRFAWFEVSDINQAPKGDPLMVSIDETSYVPVRGVAQYKGKYQATGFLTGVLASSLIRRERDGKASCKPLTDRTIRGQAALGFNVTGGTPIGNASQSSEDVWIGRDTGLPIVQSMDSTDHDGVVWVYGAAVSELPPERLVK